MFTVLYCWRIKNGFEQQFIDSWSKVTAYYLENFDSLGSRLHRGDDGLFYAYAQWKSAEQRENAFKNFPEMAAREAMREAIGEFISETILDTVSDFLVLPGK